MDEEALEEEAALLVAAWLCWLVAAAVPDSVGVVSPVQAARPKVIRAANEAKILTFFINLSAISTLLQLPKARYLASSSSSARFSRVLVGELKYIKIINLSATVKLRFLSFGVFRFR